MAGKDVYVAFFVMLAGITGLTLAYPQFIAKERPETPLSQIELGDYSYSIFSQDRCVGWMRRSFVVSDDYNFNWEGGVFVSVADTEHHYEMEGFGSFNSLGQLVGVAAHIQGPGTQITLGLEEVNPIHLTLRGKVGKRVFDYRKEIAGPVELFNSGENTVRIQYRAQSLVMPLGPQFAQLPLLDNLEFRLVSEPEELLTNKTGGSCAEDYQPLDLDSLLIPLQALMSVLP